MYVHLPCSVRAGGVRRDPVQPPDLVHVNNSVAIDLAQALPPNRHRLLHAHAVDVERVEARVVRCDVREALIQKGAVLYFFQASSC